MNLCTHGMPSPASCFECMEEGVFVCARRSEERPEVKRISEPFLARYPGYCRECDTEIDEGEFIVKMTDGSYQHSTHHKWS